jgi:nucleoside phosphorylase
MDPKKSISADAYTVGLIYVKPLEMDAITVMLDEEHESAPLQQGDYNEYTLGRIGMHNVAIVGPPIGAQGKVAIANVVACIHLTFKNMILGLLVGIGGGVPRLPKHDVRLGDVVVGAPEYGPAVVEYDLGKETTNGFKVTRTLNKPPSQLLQVVNVVRNKSRRQKKGEESFFTIHLRRFMEFPDMVEEFKRPAALDRLFLATYPHEEGTECRLHDKQYEEERSDRSPPDQIKIHYSTILSGDRVMKSEITRDKISSQFYDALCFEMEAAGLMDRFPCLVIRGICDYSDSHKNKDWQEYAAATAAAYAREILLTMAERVVKNLRTSTGSSRDIEGHCKDTGSEVVEGRKALWFSAQEFKKPLDPLCRENKLISVPNSIIKANTGPQDPQYGLSIWLCDVDFRQWDTNIRYIASNVAAGSYNVIWHFLYHLGPNAMEQINQDPQVSPHIQCSIARPQNKRLFMDRTQRPNTQVQQNLAAIFDLKTHYSEEFFLPGQLDCVPSPEWTKELRFPMRYFKIEHKVLVHEYGDLAFLVKAQGGKVEGKLGFIGVDLIP